MTSSTPLVAVTAEVVKQVSDGQSAPIEAGPAQPEDRASDRVFRFHSSVEFRIPLVGIAVLMDPVTRRPSASIRVHPSDAELARSIIAEDRVGDIVVLKEDPRARPCAIEADSESCQEALAEGAGHHAAEVYAFEIRRTIRNVAFTYLLPASEVYPCPRDSSYQPPAPGTTCMRILVPTSELSAVATKLRSLRAAVPHPMLDISAAVGGVERLTPMPQSAEPVLQQSNAITTADGLVNEPQSLRTCLDSVERSRRVLLVIDGVPHMVSSPCTIIPGHELSEAVASTVHPDTPVETVTAFHLLPTLARYGG
jgi:hypothetical protein